MTSIQDAINSYINEHKTVSPADMINDLIPEFYPLTDTSSNISFDLVLDAAKYFTTIIKRKDMCVEQSMLYKYNALSLRKNKNGEYVEDQSDVERMLKQHRSLADTIDYHTRTLAGMVERKQGGGRQLHQYIMTPKAFFMCLTRSGKTSVYAEYYFHVLEIYSYYEEYFTKMYKEKIDNLEEEIESIEIDNIVKEEKIVTLKDILAEIRQQGEESRKQNESLKSKFEIIQEESKEMQIQLFNLNDKINKMSNKLPDCTNIPSNRNLTEWLVLMIKPNTNKLYIIRSQLINLSNAISKQESKGYVQIDGLPETELVPNAMALWNVVHSKLIKEKMITCKYNDITLHCDISEFIGGLNDVFKSRKVY